ncbi:F-box protein At3g22350-like [Lolium perenne]|uniref:F-box protein At3g22350-like n=1 Tax=Lolium perenne TaxID=4522 RepID=UPI003A99B909
MDHPLAGHVALPDDLLFMEVLVRLPVNRLVRFKRVCRSWRARIEDAAFVHRHRDFSRAAPPSILVTPWKYSIDELSEDITFYCLRPGQTAGGFEARAELLLEKAACPGGTKGIHTTHCDGLVAIATTTNRIFVCNPATRELVALPPGSPDVNYQNYPSAVIGFDRCRNQYVVSRYFYRRRGYGKLSSQFDYDIGHEVFTLGGDSWELTVDPPQAIGGMPPVYTGEAFYRNYGASFTTLDVWQLHEDGTLPAAQWSLRCRVHPGPRYGKGSACYGFLPLWATGGRMLVMVSGIGQKLCWYNETSPGVEEVLDLEEDMDKTSLWTMNTTLFHTGRVSSPSASVRCERYPTESGLSEQELGEHPSLKHNN